MAQIQKQIIPVETQVATTEHWCLKILLFIFGMTVSFFGLVNADGIIIGLDSLEEMGHSVSMNSIKPIIVMVSYQWFSIAALVTELSIHLCTLGMLTDTPLNSENSIKFSIHGEWRYRIWRGVMVVFLLSDVWVNAFLLSSVSPVQWKIHFYGILFNMLWKLWWIPFCHVLSLTIVSYYLKFYRLALAASVEEKDRKGETIVSELVV